MIQSFRDLEVYQKLLVLHLEVNKLTLGFPKQELYELGAQLRRSSNSAPANLAESWNNKHTKIYLEGISRAIGEVQETGHHLDVAHHKSYLDELQHATLLKRYEFHGLVPACDGYCTTRCLYLGAKDDRAAEPSAAAVSRAAHRRGPSRPFMLPTLDRSGAGCVVARHQRVDDADGALGAAVVGRRRRGHPEAHLTRTSRSPRPSR